MIMEFESFDMEPDVGCVFDYVALYSGNSSSDPLLLKACGSMIPDPVQSSGHLLFVQFHSDPLYAHTVSFNIFLALY